MVEGGDVAVALGQALGPDRFVGHGSDLLVPWGRVDRLLYECIGMPGTRQGRRSRPRGRGASRGALISAPGVGRCRGQPRRRRIVPPHNRRHRPDQDAGAKALNAMAEAARRARAGGGGTVGPPTVPPRRSADPPVDDGHGPGPTYPADPAPSWPVVPDRARDTVGDDRTPARTVSGPHRRSAATVGHGCPGDGLRRAGRGTGRPRCVVGSERRRISGLRGHAGDAVDPTPPCRATGAGSGPGSTTGDRRGVRGHRGRAGRPPRIDAGRRRAATGVLELPSPLHPDDPTVVRPVRPRHVHDGAGAGAGDTATSSSTTSSTTTTPTPTPTTAPGGAPALTSLQPSSGAVGQAVVITGSGFYSPSGRIRATVGGQTAFVSCSNPVTCTLTIPPLTGTAPTEPVVVITDRGPSNPLTFTMH